MGIAGIFKEIGPGQRIALVKVAADHFVAHQRPFRLAIDISIWLFQIQSGKGGSNPALRTFYYRLLRLLTLNIHPLFVFDGPNKPKFKRNKRVGGSGVKVSSVPEFLAKQLLKQFGFPLHIAPGEAEAECALLQREGIVDAVLSEDVDTLMFGSGLTLRNWTPENSSKTPSHVSLYRAEKTKDISGLDREGMILVALMSGGDYIVEGIPGCGPKVACDAARAGFGKELCAVAKRKDAAALKQWRENLQHEIRTNESKFFARRSTKFSIPDDFPNREVLGYYTDPCVSTASTLARLRDDLRWDQEIDFPALRTFVADAFDWTCLGGAKKFIRNLAPAMLVQRLRFLSDPAGSLTEEQQQRKEESLVHSILGKRNHNTTDGELEYRVCFTPANLVPIDLGVEDSDDDYIPAGGAEDQAEVEDDWMEVPSGSQSTAEPTSPTKKRNFRPYDPSQPERLWMPRAFLLAGCPLMVERYEAPPTDALEVLKANRKAKTAATRRKATGPKKNGMPHDAMMAFTTVTKATIIGSSFTKQPDRAPLRAKGVNASRVADASAIRDNEARSTSSFKLPSVQPMLNQLPGPSSVSEDDKASRAISDSVTQNQAARSKQSTKRGGYHQGDPQTPQRRKRRSLEPCSSSRSQRTIESYWSVTPGFSPSRQPDIIDLLSSPVQDTLLRPATPSPCAKDTQLQSPKLLDPESDCLEGFVLPDTITKRRKRTTLRRSISAPTRADDEWEAIALQSMQQPTILEVIDLSINDALDLASPMTVASLPSPSTFIRQPPPSVPDESSIAFCGTTGFEKSKVSPEVEVVDLSETQAQFVAPTQEVSYSRLPQVERTKKSIRLRDSLPGSWREVNSEEQEPMPGIDHVRTSVRKFIHQSLWRTSDVEILDLTGA